MFRFYILNLYLNIILISVKVFFFFFFILYMFKYKKNFIYISNQLKSTYFNAKKYNRMYVACSSYLSIEGKKIKKLIGINIYVLYVL